jgi:hypothetical protein
MRRSYATQIECDGCGATEVVPQPPNMTGPVPGPDGWLSGLTGWEVIRYNGVPLRDFCPTCLRLPFGQLIMNVYNRKKGEGADGDGD